MFWERLETSLIKMLSPENNSSLEPNEISLLYVTVPENSIKSLVNLIFVFGQMEWYLSNL